jgi:alpha-L-fucosidase
VPICCLKRKRPLTSLLAAVSAVTSAALLFSPADAQSGPRASPELVTAADAAAPIPPGPYQPTWDSLKANYAVPEWFRDAEFGIFMHKFGYVDFITLFTAAKWNPDAWAALFKKAGAKYVVPTAEHHDGCARTRTR